MRVISFSSTCFCYYRKDLNNVTRFIHYHLLITSNSTFMTHSQFLVIIQVWWNLNEHKYYLTSTDSVISQIDVNCSPFQSLTMVPFHIRLESLKLIYYSLISHFSLYCFKTGILCLLFSSSHLFTALDFDSNYFGILWKKPRDHNKIKPPIEKIFPKYKPIRHFFVMFRK